MACKTRVTKDMIDDSLATIGIIDGKLILVSELDSLRYTIKKISKHFYENSSIIDIIGDDTDVTNLVRLKVNYPTEEEIADGGGKNSSYKFSSMSQKALEEAIGSESKLIETYFHTALETLETISDSKFKKNLRHLPVNVQQDLRKLRTELSAYDISEDGLKGISRFIADGKVSVDRVQQVLEDLETNDNEDIFIVYSELNNLVNQFMPFFKSIVKVVNPDEYLGKIIGETILKIQSINAAHDDAAVKFSVEKLTVTYNGKIKAELTRHTEELRILDGHISKSLRPKLLQEKRVRLIEKFNEEGLTEEKISKTLRGENGDISYLMNLFRAGQAIPDVVIGGVISNVRSSLRKINGQLQSRRADAAKALRVRNEARKSDTTIKERHNIQADGQTLTESVLLYEVKVEEVDGKEVRSIVGKNVPMLLHEHDSEFDTVTSLISAAYRSEIEWNELSKFPFVAQYASEYSSIKEWDNAYHKESSELMYTPYFYKVEELLNNTFEFNGRTQALREIRNDSFEQLNNLQSEIKMNGGVVTDEDIVMHKHLSKDRLILFSIEGKEEGTVEHDVAVAMKEYNTLRKEFTERKVTDKKRAAFERALDNIKKMESLGNIPEGSTQKWLALHTNYTTSLEYQSETKRIRSQLNSNREKLEVLLNISESESTWNDLTDFMKPYYEDGQKVATAMSEDALQSANKQHKNLIELQAGYQFAHLSDDLKRAYKTLVFNKNQANFENQNEPSTENKDVLDKLTTDLKEFVNTHTKELSKESKAIIAQNNELYKELGKLQSTENTSYYDIEYQRQLALFIDKESITSIPPTKFEFKGAVFEYRDGEFWRTLYGDTTKVNQSVIDTAWKSTFMTKFQESEWYQDNHYVKFEYIDKQRVPVMKPTYPWTKKVPRNRKDILEFEPAQAWMETKVNESFVDGDGKTILIHNPSYKLDARGRAIPKQGYKVNTKWDNLEQYDKDYLKYIRDQYYEDQLLYPESKALGRKLPAIERNNNIVDVVMNIKQDGLETTASRVGRQVARGFVSDAQDYDEAYGNIDRDYLPVYFSQEIDPNLQDYNIHQIFLKYAKSSMQFKELQGSSLPLIQATEAVLHNNPPEKAANKLLDKLGLSKLSKSDENIRLGLLRSQVDAIVYGQSQKKSEGFTIKEDTFGLGKFKSLHGVNIRWEKVFNNFLGMRAFGLMNFSFLPQISNAANGVFQSLIESAGEKGLLSFTPKAYAQSILRVNKVYAPNYMKDMQSINNKSKSTLMIEFFDAIPGELYDNVGYELEGNLARTLMSTDIGFFLKNSVEWYLGATVFDAMSHSHMINGVPIWDIFEAIDGKLEVKEGMNITPAQIDNFVEKVRAANWDINGNYAKIDKSIIEQEWYGRAMFFMKKYVLPFFERRYSSNRFSPIHGRHIEGFYILGGKSMLKMLTTMTQNFDLLYDARSLSPFYNELSDTEKDAMKKFLIEIAMFGLLTIVGSMVWDEDDEDRFKDLKKKNAMHQTFIYGLLKTRKEVESFVLPFSLNENINMGQRSLQEVLPIITQLGAILSNDFDLDEEGGLSRYKRKTGKHKKGDAKLWVDLSKLLGNMDTKYDPVSGIKVIDRLL